MKKTLGILSLLVFGVCTMGFSQIKFNTWDSIPVINNTDTLIYAFVGGFNNPQFSDVDMNGDGVKDIFVFDRSTQRGFSFLNGGTQNAVDYYYVDSMRYKFPKLENWVLLEDYNCDGKEDIFTYDDNSFKVYRNDYSITTGLQFTLIYKFSSSFIYIGSSDIPAFTDVDSDGDLDLLTFDPSGSFMYYYKNQSIENYGVCDSLIFSLDDMCWGKFKEDFGGCSVTLNESTCKGGGKELQKKHAGSSVLALDLNGDTLKEVIIGDLTCNNAYMLTNGGSLSSANIINYDTQYPILNPIDIEKFPATFLLDVNNDGLQDLIAAPNAPLVSENNGSVVYYQNIGTTILPDFDKQTNKFLVNEMIEVGEGANPVFFDYNGDSLLDLVIGNYGYFSATLPRYPSGLTLYQNIGSLQNPVFSLVTKDYLGIEAYSLNGVYPAFGDLDNDGDIDLILGDYTGQLYFFKNTAGAGNVANFVLTTPFYSNIDVGQFAAPQIVDVNLDGKLDLLIGERDGTINYFENLGTPTNPVFNSSPTIPLFGGIDVYVPCCTGYSSPFLTHLKSTGEYTLLVGTEKGDVYQYTNIDNNLNGTFTLVDTLFQGINEGERNSISGGDLNNDGKTDIVVGNYGGGIKLFKNVGETPVLPKPPIDTLTFSISIFPNPASHHLTVQIQGLVENENVEIKIYNVIGQQIYNREHITEFNNWVFPISLDHVAKGVYFLKLKIITNRDLPQTEVIKKFIID